MSSHNKGMTLVEIIVVTAIAGIIGMAVAAFSRDIFSFNRILTTSLQNQTEAKRILRPFVNEVRSASRSALGSYPIATAASSTFTFYSDVDDDGKSERLRYYLEGTDFKKGVTVASGNPLVYDDADEEIIEVVHDVVATSTPIFTYYNTDYDGTSSSAPLTQPVQTSSVRLVKATLVVDSDINSAPPPLVISTQVTLRNLKDNL